ncbi:hypothetical protein [Chitinophaga sp. Cy-1792]|uniref:hypothetical protein n=1 Tax=Chitinophaga sp. Cy-1792 TaxID=2608339 RepID=UPI0014207DA9|nr:hypothetical protein [Chitinophaga sp. Cy-1792]NIG55719.1 hypothetical protein [Chitinophaga sp. Cy-1792]
MAVVYLSGLILLMLVIIFLVKSLFINPYLLKKNHAFTTGIIVKIEPSNEGAPTIHYEFTVDGKVYMGYMGLDIYADVYVGGQYEVMYYPPDPTISELQV